LWHLIPAPKMLSAAASKPHPSYALCDLRNRLYQLSRPHFREHMTGRRNAQIDFDIAALFDALDAQRRDRMLSWQDVARELWDLSATLNARRKDHPISASTLAGMAKRRGVSQFRAIFLSVSHVIEVAASASCAFVSRADCPWC
jgi:hypothetical protein